MRLLAWVLETIACWITTACIPVQYLSTEFRLSISLTQNGTLHEWEISFVSAVQLSMSRNSHLCQASTPKSREAAYIICSQLHGHGNKGL